MNVLLLSPHFPPNHIHYARALKQRGLHVLGIGDTPHISHELASYLDDYYYVADMTDLDAMLRAVAFLTFKHGKIDRLDSHNEFWLGIEAFLREEFNIPGQRPAQTDLNRSKLGMKIVCKKHDIPTAQAEEVENVAQIKAFAKRVGYPLVVKPVIGVGATATYKVSSNKEVDEAFDMLHGHYLCEKFIEGDIVTYDGLIDANGEVIFDSSLAYNEGVMESVNEVRSLYYYLGSEVAPKLKKSGRCVLDAFGVRERFFHIEFFKLTNGEYVFLEINVRPPGLYTIDMMNFSADIDLYDAWAAMLNGQRAFKTFERKYCVGFAGRRAKTAHKHSHDEIMQRYGEFMIQAREVPGTYRDAMGEFYYIVRHPSQKKVIEILDYMLEM